MLQFVKILTINVRTNSSLVYCISNVNKFQVVESGRHKKAPHV